MVDSGRALHSRRQNNGPSWLQCPGVQHLTINTRQPVLCFSFILEYSIDIYKVFGYRIKASFYTSHGRHVAAPNNRIIAEVVYDSIFFIAIA